MKLKFYFDYVKKVIKELWEFKLFKYVMLTHIVYMIISIILAFTIFCQTNDFLVFYKSAEIFLNNFEDLYNRDLYGNAWEFRYFPLSPLMFVPFYFLGQLPLGFEMGFVLFTIFNFILNIFIYVILFRIINVLKPQLIENDKSRFALYISLFFIGYPQLVNYLLGQINLYITFLILLSLYVFLKYNNIKWDFIGSLILGMSIILKPTTILLIPFILIIHINWKKKQFKFNVKKNITRLFGSILPLFINVIVFLFFPKLWNGFLETNFTGTNPTDISFSFSLTKLILNFFVFYGLDFSQTLIFLMILSIFGILGFLIYIFKGNFKSSIIYGFIYGILITFISYFEVWEHHLLTLIPFLIIILIILPINSNISKIFIKPCIFIYNILSALFAGIFLLTIDFFPYNFGVTLFLILNFYAISKYYLTKNRDRLDQ